jgi:hypothetical protein
MKQLLLAALAVGLLVGANDPKKDKGKKGATVLEGTWVVASVIVEGDEEEKEKKLPRVAGKVLLDGQPLAKANVVFVPVNKKGQKATGTTNEDGTFELTTGRKKGAFPGEYKIVITKKVAGKSVLRAEYGAEKTTPLKFTVAEGRNTIDIHLKSK